jgi:hypothetical protein
LRSWLATVCKRHIDDMVSTLIGDVLRSSLATVGERHPMVCLTNQ